VHPAATIAPSAHLIGKVQIGAGAYIDHGAILESSGPPVVVEDESVVFAGAALRSLGGSSRPGFPLHVGSRTLVSPLCVLSGCRVGSNCYVATAAIVLQGAEIGDHVRVGAGAIVHAGTAVPQLARIGMRHIAVSTEEGFLSTADIERAREVVGDSNFFEVAFGVLEDDQEGLHAAVLSTLLREVHAWRDQPVGET
jgi:carbonic anhydrase/acetyltransferase-like protein (isoleucine patch superfamily)